MTMAMAGLKIHRRGYSLSTFKETRATVDKPDPCDAGAWFAAAHFLRAA